MANQQDYSGEFRFWSGTQPVTVTVQESGGDVDVSVSDALNGDISRNATTILGIVLSSDDTIWTIPDALMDGHSIREANKITEENGTVWVVLTSKLISVGTCPVYWTVAATKKR